MMKRALTTTARSSLASSRRTFVQTEKVYPENDGFDPKSVKINTAEWPEEFRYYDPTEPLKDCKDITPWSSWGLVWIAFQIQFILVFGEGEEGFDFCDYWRKQVESPLG
eukprot:TRINITY_DN1917_c7_g1_i1.p1 TRINITY_DN1917_c7_g1~~TRINITY_DN1917_c7_g1_i1.p1  ORF type:complete len:126 (+),score=22.84 TRINITY_DN1917_c7_g1_i1:52-378(+)